MYAATHSTEVDERQGGYDRAFPIDIGDDCWIGAGSMLNGPCKIGKGCTVAAGADVSLLFQRHPERSDAEDRYGASFRTIALSAVYLLGFSKGLSRPKVFTI